MLRDETEKKIKKEKKLHMLILVYLSNLQLESWDQDNPIESKKKNYKPQYPIILVDIFLKYWYGDILDCIFFKY
jgi:hypothetical protein